MKLNKRFFAALTLLALVAVAALAVGCAEQKPSGKIELVIYNRPLDMHTEMQSEYLLSGNPSILDKKIDAKHEYSLPKAITLAWRNSRECKSYIVDISEKADFSDGWQLQTNTTSVDVYNLKIATNYYWKVTEDVDGGVTSAVGTFTTVDYGPRNLWVDGVTNVRDFGGRQTSDGGRVAQGLLYRGGRLNNSYPEGWVKDGDDTGYTVEAEITVEGMRVFTQVMKIKTEVDLRTRDRNGYPGTTDQDEQLYSVVDGVRYVSIPMSGNAQISQNKAEIKQLFQLLADVNNYPVYFHCNIGTDRTGMVSYLLGALCGMSEQDLYYDYMFSNFGLIALPSPQVTNPERKELADLTKAKGAAGTVNSFDGDTLRDKAVACLIDCGLSQSTIDAVYNILTGKTPV